MSMAHAYGMAEAYGMAHAYGMAEAYNICLSASNIDASCLK